MRHLWIPFSLKGIIIVTASAGLSGYTCLETFGFWSGRTAGRSAEGSRLDFVEATDQQKAFKVYCCLGLEFCDVYRAACASGTVSNILSALFHSD